MGIGLACGFKTKNKMILSQSSAKTFFARDILDDFSNLAGDTSVRELSTPFCSLPKFYTITKLKEGYK